MELFHPKVAVLFNEGKVEEMYMYLKNNWKEITAGLHNATILILARGLGKPTKKVTDDFIKFNQQRGVCSLHSVNSVEHISRS